MSVLTRIQRAAVSLGVTLCLGAPGFAYANPAALTPQDFYKGAELETASPAPFYRLTLPPSVYRESTAPDLRDLRVFNGAGQPVTFALSTVESASEQQQHIALRVFPTQMRIEKADEAQRGNKVTVTSVNGVDIAFYERENKAFSQSYLLQADEEDVALDRLRVDWTASTQNWQATAAVYSSRDLKNWRKQVDRAPLMDLTSGNDRLMLNEIALSDGRAPRARYWLLVMQSDSDIPALTLDKAEGIATVRRDRQETVDLRFSAKTYSTAQIEYTLERATPLVSLSLLPSQYNAVLPVQVDYASTDEEAWRPLTRTVIYQIDDQSGHRASQPLPLNERLVKKVRLTAINGSWADAQPEVIGQRKRVDVVFNAQGNPPFLVAWGARQVSEAAIPLSQLIPPGETLKYGLEALPVARISDIVILGGEQRLTAASAEERANQWQTGLLWALLIVGVAGLALIVVKLAREVKGGKS